MTSGQFDSVLIDSIIINREERHRSVLTGVDDLAVSIKKYGLIHPPVITRERVLLVGEQRYEACRKLGWTSISILWADEVSEDEMKLIEYEENARRNDLPWQDIMDAIRGYHGDPT
jgi:ParB-like chromosome segregation protein Spo0J